MTFAFTLLTALVVLATLVYVVFNTMTYFSDQHSHKRGTTANTNKWSYGTYKRFLIEFNARTWGESAGALIDPKTHSVINESIVCFNNQGMVLSGYDFIKYRRFYKNYRLRKNQDDSLWSDSTITKSVPKEELSAGDKALEDFKNSLVPNKGGKSV